MTADPAKLLLSREEAAAVLGRRPSTLRSWYARGIGPAATKHGNARQGRIAYAVEDIALWVRAGCPLGSGARPPGIPVGKWASDARGPRGRFTAKVPAGDDA